MKYIALDIGDVLVKTNFEGFLKKLSKTIDISLDDASYFMNRSQKLHDLGLTVMTDELKDHFKIKSSVIVEELVDWWNDCIQPASYVIEKLNKIHKEHDLKVALLSNIGLEHAAQIDYILNDDGFMDRAVKYFSCFVGARKPTSLYYQSFLQLHPEWKGCLYIDDLQENLDASKQFGFKTYKFSLKEITGLNYDDTIFNNKMIELEKIIIQ